MSGTHQDADRSGGSSFDLLDERLQRWVRASGWSKLHDIQERAIPLVLEAKQDVILAAKTAGGKTEAALLPILSKFLRPEEAGACAIYITPLKALINDQRNRMLELCEPLEISVIGWHGDISAGNKKRFLKNPSGILLITPESLEAMLMLHGTMVGHLFGRVRYIVVDELHATIGTDRGKQMQSLMHRIDLAHKSLICRIGLSATLGDMSLAAEALRPKNASRVVVIESDAEGQELHAQVRGYKLLPAPPKAKAKEKAVGDEEELDETPELQALREVADHLYAKLRGSNNLVFPNSRRKVEVLAHLLRQRAEDALLPNEFWAHHGSLSKDLREEAEQALKNHDRPATAVCTTTLELGIDIGAVKSVAQVGPPPSVASLRQRLGRSGRREGEPAILRAYCIEPNAGENDPITDRLHEGLVQTIACLRLLVKGWCEAPRTHARSYSTLVQQVMSIIFSQGGANAAGLYHVLIETGPFDGMEPGVFVSLLRAMGEADLIVQESSGILLLGQKGERFASHYEFYAAFAADDEWQILRDGKLLGTLPITSSVWVGMGLMYGGRSWKVVDVDSGKLRISVIADRRADPPKYDSGRPFTDDEVRREMRVVLAGSDDLPYLDGVAREMLSVARSTYKEAGLDRKPIISRESDHRLFTWCGDWVNDALCLMLKQMGAAACTNNGLFISVSGWDADELKKVLVKIGKGVEVGPDVLCSVENMRRGKWDWVLPQKILWESFTSTWLDIPGAISVAKSLGATI